MTTKFKKLIEKLDILKQQQKKIEKYEKAFELIQCYLINNKTKSEKYLKETPKDFKSLYVISSICNSDIERIVRIMQ